MATEQKKATEKPVREVSSIQFPYLDLDDAISVARAMWQTGGQSLAKDQLAGAMNQSPTSGNFIMKITTARMFGLIDFNQGKYTLTTLGYEINDSNVTRVAAAKAAAFLKVPLYHRTFEAFRGKSLPPRQGLEQAFVEFGVSAKQKDKARQAFERSADQAGYFAASRDRLVPPVVGATPATPPAPVIALEPELQHSGPSKDDRLAMPALDELILGLLKRLPEPGENWDLDKRIRWLRALATNLEEVYPREDQGRAITISTTNTPD